VGLGGRLLNVAHLPRAMGERVLEKLLHIARRRGLSGCTRHLLRGISTLTRHAHGGGDDRISGTHADRHDDISHNTIAVVHLTLREWSLAALWQLSRFVIFGQLLITDL
jgi:hypothetical protein